MLATVKKTSPYFPSLFNTIWGDNFLNDVDYATNHAVNIAEDKNGFRIEVAAPGMSKGDFRIHVEKHLLEISSEKETKKETKDEKYLRREFSYSNFRRSFSLPEDVNTDEINATYEDGILTVTLPKKEEAKEKPAREIAIK